MSAASRTEDDAYVRARRFVVAMGIVAMLGDFTYEGARSISGAYLAMLGASATVVGVVAGAGELVGYAMRLVAGLVADRTRSHWTLVALGYGINLVAVPGLALTGRVEHAALLVILERLGKAIRSPSKSVLLADAASHVGHGKAFGIEEALDQIGAVGGPLIVAGVMTLHGGDDLSRARAAFAALLVPVLLTLAVLRFARTRLHPEVPAVAPTSNDGAMGRRFVWTLAAVSLIAFGLADWAILAVHAGRAGILGATGLPLAYAGAMAVDGAAALVFGHLFDRAGLRALALAACFGAVAPVLLFSSSLVSFAIGAVLWAIALGALESISKAAIAASVAPASRARAYGTFFAGFGLAWWLGSSAIGALYDRSIDGAIALSTSAQAIGALLLFVLARGRPRTTEA